MKRKLKIICRINLLIGFIANIICFCLILAYSIGVSAKNEYLNQKRIEINSNISYAKKLDSLISIIEPKDKTVRITKSLSVLITEKTKQYNKEVEDIKISSDKYEQEYVELEKEVNVLKILYDLFNIFSTIILIMYVLQYLNLKKWI